MKTRAMRYRLTFEFEADHGDADREAVETTVMAERAFRGGKLYSTELVAEAERPWKRVRPVIVEGA